MVTYRPWVCCPACAHRQQDVGGVAWADVQVLQAGRRASPASLLCACQIANLPQ